MEALRDVAETADVVVVVAEDLATGITAEATASKPRPGGSPLPLDTQALASACRLPLLVRISGTGEHGILRREAMSHRALHISGRILLTVITTGTIDHAVIIKEEAGLTITGARGTGSIVIKMP